VLTASDSQPNPKSVFYKFGDEKLKAIVNKAYPGISRGDVEIAVGDEIINDWSMNVGTCILLGEHIIVHQNLLSEYVNLMGSKGVKSKIRVEMSMKVEQLRKAIENVDGTPNYLQRLIVAGKPLKTAEC
jgi:hypothetical protein